MTGRSDSEKVDPDRGNNTGRLLFAAVLVFAVLATLALVFADSTKWLKLAVIAALWAAFFGAMLGVKYRHQAADRESAVADLQSVYELELEREVAARREYELEVEAETRRRIAEDSQDESREDLAALRAELHALRENLDRLTGGEVLVERIALRAQSTRMRTIGGPNMNVRAIAADENIRRSITAGPARQMPQPIDQQMAKPVVQAVDRPTGRGVDTVFDPSTELMAPASPTRRQDVPQGVGAQRAETVRRIDATQRVRTAQRIDAAARIEGSQHRPTPTRNQDSRVGPIIDAVDRRLVEPSRSPRSSQLSDQRESSVDGDRVNREQARFDRLDAGIESRLDRGEAHVDPRFDRADSAQRSTPAHRDPAEERPSLRRAEASHVPAPSRGEHSRTNLRHDPSDLPAFRSQAGPTNNSMMARSAANADSTSASTRYAASVPRSASPTSGAGAASKAGAMPSVGSTAASSSSSAQPSPRLDGRVARAAGDGPANRPPTAQPSRHGPAAERLARPVTPPRSHADLPPSGTSQGGRRRAEPADWTQEPDVWADESDSRSEGARRGRHGDGAQYSDGRYDSGSYESVAATASASVGAGARSGGRRAEPEPAGAHTAGRSVTELLAAHNPAEDSPRRHRRRAE